MGRAQFPFVQARIERHGRRHAVTAVELALLVCEAGAATEAQLADLADAVDALRAKQYAVATILAEAAIEGRSKVQTAIRPRSMARSIREVRSAFDELEID